MKRFKNILVVYDVIPGCDETLQRAVDVATRNKAHLTVAHTVNPLSEERQTLDERDRLMKRVTGSLRLPPSQKSYVVRQGPGAECILKLAHEIGADLIISPDVTKGFYTRLLGFDVSTELLRRADCPVWIVRPQAAVHYRRIVAAVNVGKPDALSCPSNRRILEMASSMAILEEADLHVVYVWDYEGNERDMMHSELPPGRRQEISAQSRLKNLGLLVDLVEHVLGDFSRYTAVPIRGNPRAAIVDYIDQQDADLLIIEGRIDGALKSVLTENTATHLLNQSNCSVLFSRTIAETQAVRTLEAV